MQSITKRLSNEIPIRPKAYLLLLLQSLDEWAYKKIIRTLLKWYF